MHEVTDSKTCNWFAPDRGCFFIAEIGVNHNGELGLARQLIDVAAQAGADAVKFQTFTAETLTTKSAAKANYQIKNDDTSSTQIEMLKRLELSEADLAECRDYCAKVGIEFLSTPFDEPAAALLKKLGVDGFKVSSGDLTHLPFLEHLSQYGLPMIISTGMGTLGEVEDAVRTIEAAGDPPLAVLHCVSDYPALAEDCNLRAMDTLRTAFNKPVGWSDHTAGDAIAIAAVARGARIIEKHFTLDRGLPGPDHKASLTPEELKSLISKIRLVEMALGTGEKRPTANELSTAEVARRSVVAARSIPAGHQLEASDIGYKRPGLGLPPRMAGLVIGRTAVHDIPEDTLISLSDLG